MVVLVDSDTISEIGWRVLAKRLEGKGCGARSACTALLNAICVKRHEAQGLQAARRTSHCPSSGCERTRISMTASCQANVTLSNPSSGCKRTRSSRTASYQANVTKLKDCKLPGKRHILQALVVSVPEAQGLQAHCRGSGCKRKRSSRTASCRANVTFSKLWL